MTRFAEKLVAGEAVYGPFLKLNSPAAVEIIAACGYDFVIIDREHGTFSFEAVESLIRTAQSCGLASIVRLRSLLPREIGVALDCGATGIMAPMIETAEMARDLVGFSRFPPHGRRGVDGTTRLGGYATLNMLKATREQEKALVIFAQIETKRGLENLESILEVLGLTGLFVGPNDLAWSLGYAGSPEAAEVASQCQKIIRAARQKGLTAGIYARNIDVARYWQSFGANLFGLSSDVAFLRDGARLALGL